MPDDSEIAALRAELTTTQARLARLTDEAFLESTILQWMNHQQAWGRPVVGELAAKGAAAFLATRLQAGEVS